MHFFVRRCRWATWKSAPPPSTLRGQRAQGRRRTGSSSPAGSGTTNRSSDLAGDTDPTTRRAPRPRGGADRRARPRRRRTPTRGIVSFTRPLPGWDGRPVARLLVCNDSATITELNHSTRQLLALLVGFALVLLAVLTCSLMRWVEPAAAAHLARRSRPNTSRPSTSCATRRASSAAWRS